MAPYRITLFNQIGSVSGKHLVECDHDDEAIEWAGRINHPHDVFVWQGVRFVGRFPPWPRNDRVLRRTEGTLTQEGAR